MSLVKGVFGVWILPLRASWWSKPSGKDGKEGWLALGHRLDLSLLGKWVTCGLQQHELDTTCSVASDLTRLTLSPFSLLLLLAIIWLDRTK